MHTLPPILELKSLTSGRLLVSPPRRLKRRARVVGKTQAEAALLQDQDDGQLERRVEEVCKVRRGFHQGPKN